MNDFTKGELDGWTVYAQHIFICSGLNKESANLIAAAGKTANALAEQGIDAIAALNLLPELIKLNANPTAVYELYITGEQEEE